MRTRLGCPACSLGAALVALSLVLGIAPTGAASAAARFRPRVGTAMGLVPPPSRRADLASGPPIPVVYHGGEVMRGPVTVHTVFWAPAGHSFAGAPGAGVPGYEATVQTFFADVAHDSGSTGNAFSVLGEYPQTGTGSGYSVAYDPATDSIDDTAPYPGPAGACPSPAGAATCVTDAALTRELDRLIAARAPSARGLHDLWMVFLPPGVDECTALGSCGTSDFAGYHSVFNRGAGPTVYAVIIDPLLEGSPAAGNDPLGNPDAESALDTAAHELVEGVTDPYGTGWMDPNGFEVGDKCEIGPQIGAPLGYAPNGSPFNQVIDGRRYLLQAMWSNAAPGCVQASRVTTSALPLASVSLHQFSPFISGDTGRRRAGVSVAVALVRAGERVALARTRTRADGRWGPVALRPDAGAVHAVGDDRDEIAVVYGHGGPKPDLILTGSGGNPFSQSGFTGWYDLDTGFRVDRHYTLIAPCSQVGVLDLRVAGVATAPPATLCGTESDVAKIPTRPVDAGTRITFTSEDNRAPSGDNPAGALVALTIRPGEPGSAQALNNDNVLLLPGGLPSCTADLRAQAVHCAGLVPGARYRLTRRRGRVVLTARADPFGIANFGRLPGASGVRGGDLLTLRNTRRRVLTTLHVAHLRVAINGNETVLAGGHCEPGDYYGPPLDQPPASAGVGDGVSGSGTTCPSDGTAAGLPASSIEQSDDRSGGLTRTAVPLLEGESPGNDATVSGAFIALAQSGLPTAIRGVYAGGAPIALRVTRAGSSATVFAARNVDTAQGVRVPALPPGVYAARWIVSDANGDTRTVRTRFISAG